MISALADERTIRAVGLSKLFPANNIQAIGDISFTVERGETVAFVGPSGSGKTTLFRILSGLERPDAGTISIFGRTPSQARKCRLFAHVFQTPALLPWASVIDNVRLPSKVVGGSTRAAEEALSLVGLKGRNNAFPHELSGGMAQRVAVARALTLFPEILLLDEPFNSLDERSREEAQDLVIAIHSAIADMTVLLITHSLSEAAYLADKVIVLSQRPATVAAVLGVSYSQPRSPELRETSQLRATAQRIRSCLG